MAGRIEALRARQAAEGLEGFLVTRPENLRYLTGFTGSVGALLVTPRTCLLMVDFRYLEQARRECPGVEIAYLPRRFWSGVAGHLRDAGLKSVGCEGDFLTWQQVQALQREAGNVELRPVVGLVEGLRLVKDEEEIAYLERAVALAEEGFRAALPLFRPGASEAEAALGLEVAIRRAGAERVPFEIIVASGPRAAWPHARPSDRVMEPGDLVIVDFGAVYRGYCADLTRTLVVGRPRPEDEELYALVRRAQLAGLEALRPGAAAREVDRAVREVIAAAGHGDDFGHSTGHGLGLAVHEDPRLAETEEGVLAAGMVVTVEPGVYLPGRGGVRIEDPVVVTAGGCRVLSGLPGERLISIGEGQV
ncbi:MAG: aminopeptidase P family protein [Firmicutes bacterium]|nr:aminopeptidase P family protein [Bacillota bacterium]